MRANLKMIFNKKHILECFYTIVYHLKQIAFEKEKLLV